MKTQNLEYFYIGNTKLNLNTFSTNKMYQLNQLDNLVRSTKPRISIPISSAEERFNERRNRRPQESALNFGPNIIRRKPRRPRRAVSQQLRSSQQIDDEEVKKVKKEIKESAAILIYKEWANKIIAQHDKNVEKETAKKIAENNPDLDKEELEFMIEKRVKENINGNIVVEFERNGNKEIKTFQREDLVKVTQTGKPKAIFNSNNSHNIKSDFEEFDANSFSTIKEAREYFRGSNIITAQETKGNKRNRAGYLDYYMIDTCSEMPSVQLWHLDTIRNQTMPSWQVDNCLKVAMKYNMDADCTSQLDAIFREIPFNLVSLLKFKEIFDIFPAYQFIVRNYTETGKGKKTVYNKDAKKKVDLCLIENHIFSLHNKYGFKSVQKLVDHIKTNMIKLSKEDEKLFIATCEKNKQTINEIQEPIKNFDYHNVNRNKTKLFDLEDGKKLAKNVFVFDTETTTDGKHECFQLVIKSEDKEFKGEKNEEGDVKEDFVIQTFNKLTKYCKKQGLKEIILYAHNAQYDYYQLFEERFQFQEDIVMSNNQFYQSVMIHNKIKIEIRDSYKLIS